MEQSTNETLIALFDMLNDRLYNIEQNSNKLVNHLKRKCFKNGLLDKEVFDYPIDVSLFFHGYNKTLNNESYAYVTINNCDLEKRSNDSYYPMYTCHYHKVRPLLEQRLTSTQLEKIDNHQKQITINDQDMKCQDIGIVDDVNMYIHDYLANIYIKSKYDMVDMVVLNITEICNDIIIKNITSIDDIVKCACNVYNDLCLPLSELIDDTTNDAMYVTICPSTDWKNIELLLNNIDTKYIAKQINLDNKTISSYRESVINLIKSRSKTSHVWYIDNTLQSSSNSSTTADETIEVFDNLLSTREM